MNNFFSHIEFSKLNRKQSFLDILIFLKDIDNDFPIPLSSKCSLTNLAKKFDQVGDVIVAKNGNNIIGLIAGYVENSIDTIGFLSVLGVTKKYRGLGIGNTLLSKMIEFAKNQNNKKIVGLHLYTNRSNYSALRLYKKSGFEQFIIKNEARKNDIHLVLYF